jgi:hypothetical protein
MFPCACARWRTRREGQSDEIEISVRDFMPGVWETETGNGPQGTRAIRAFSRTPCVQAADIDFLLARHPNLRVAYIDTSKVNKTDEKGKNSVVDEFYSVLIKAVPVRSFFSTQCADSMLIQNEEGGHHIREVYRVKLPGNPILGVRCSALLCSARFCDKSQIYFLCEL